MKTLNAIKFVLLLVLVSSFNACIEQDEKYIKKPAPVATPLPGTVISDGCPVAEPPPPRAGTVKSETVVTPETKSDPEKVKRQEILEECLAEFKPSAPTAWLDELKDDDIGRVAQKDLAERLKLQREHYFKCAPVMRDYVAESEIANSQEKPDPSKETFAKYLTNPKFVEDRIGNMVRAYGYTMYLVAQSPGKMPGYDFSCEKECNAPTRYEVVADLIELMKKYSLSPTDVWQNGRGSELRRLAKIGFQEMYREWALGGTEAARAQLKQKICLDLPKADENLKPLLDVELDALDCEGKKTQFGECQSFKQVTRYSRCAEYAFKATGGTCIIPNQFPSPPADPLSSMTAYCALLESQNSAANAATAILPPPPLGCDSDKDCKGNRICIDGKCVEPMPEPKKSRR